MKPEKKLKIWKKMLLSGCCAVTIAVWSGNNALAETVPETEAATGEMSTTEEMDTAEETAAEGTGAAQPDLNLYAKSAVLMDGESGRVLYEKDGNIHMPNASTTKIMTCILTLELGNLEDEVKVSSYASSMPQVRLGMSTDDTFRLKDLLYSLMLESHNDSAVAIAEHIGGSVENFAAMMNEKAKELGCKDTYFITPNGLDAQDENGVHGTTAEDLAKIMSYCIKNETFLEITRTPEYSFSNLAGTKQYSCRNHNAFLQMMEGALSGKTGFTGDAGYCYVGALKRDNRTYVVALLACGWPNHKNWKWSDTTALMNYGLEQYNYEDVFEYGKEFQQIPIENARPQNDRLYQEVTSELEIREEPISILKRKDEAVHIIYDVPETLEAPVKAGQQVGKAMYYLNEMKIAEVPIYIKNGAQKLDISWYRDYICRLFFMNKRLNFNL